MRLVWGKVQLIKEKLMLMRMLFNFLYWHHVWCFPPHVKEGFMIKTTNWI